MRKLALLFACSLTAGCTLAAFEEHEGASAVATCQALESTLCARIETCVGEVSETCGLTWEGEPVPCDEVTRVRIEAATFEGCQEDIDALPCEDVEAGALPESCQALAFTLAE